MAAKTALRANKAVYKSLIQNPHEINISDVKKNLRTIESSINQLTREMLFAEERHRVELEIVKVEASRDAIDAEAHSARIAERMRFLLQRNVDDVAIVDRAASNVKFVESAIAALDPHPPLTGVALKNVNACSTQAARASEQ